MRPTGRESLKSSSTAIHRPRRAVLALGEGLQLVRYSGDLGGRGQRAQVGPRDADRDRHEIGASHLSGATARLDPALFSVVDAVVRRRDAVEALDDLAGHLLG